MSGRIRMLKWIKFCTPKKPFTQKQKERYEKHIRKVMEDFEEVWGDDLERLDWVDELSEDNSDNPKTI